MNNTVVLLVDKDKNFIKAIIRELKGSDFVFYWACDFDEAMDYFEDNIIEANILVIGDIEEKKEKKVKELIKNFRQKYPEILVVVSNSIVEASNKLLSAGTAKYTLHDPELVSMTLKAAI